jgi:serine protease AprX
MANNVQSELGQMPESDPKKPWFNPEVLDKTVIAIPLLKKLREEERLGKPRQPHAVIIDLNLDYQYGRDAARQRVKDLIAMVVQSTDNISESHGINDSKSKYSQQYVFGVLDGEEIRELVRLDSRTPDRGTTGQPGPTGRPSGQMHVSHRAIYRIWPDFPVKGLITKSISTVKADAARFSFSAKGENIVWALMDSGISQHKHFSKYHNLELASPLKHRDFTVQKEADERPLEDEYGHGTHVAGIIAGEITEGEIRAATKYRNEHGDTKVETTKLEAISGMAPKCKLLSLKVLDGDGQGTASNLIAAIETIQEINGYGRQIRIHGLNMSVGYDFEPEWFACGQSPLCVEVDRLVKSGVVVVAAAGNTGYGWHQTEARGGVAAGMGLTINDPGNAQLAITVGSTHRYMPHIYGVSYFSSKGPTGDGRIKPDVVAPGEKILSCATGNLLREAVKNELEDMPNNTNPDTVDYVESSGTSMAAPHVSGVIAAFLSVRQEFIGKAETIKEIFLSTATDLKRDRYFQGHGLIDLMRAIQSV